MVRHIFLIAILSLTCSPALAQYLIGEPRDTVETRLEETISVEANLVISDSSTVCYDVPILNQRQCFDFVNKKCRSEAKTRTKVRKSDVMKKLATLKREWGQPVAYAADFTEVETIRQAVALADPLVVVAFPKNEDGIGLIWEWNTNPKDEGLAGGRYRYMVQYVDVSHVEKMPITNYWR